MMIKLFWQRWLSRKSIPVGQFHDLLSLPPFSFCSLFVALIGGPAIPIPPPYLHTGPKSLVLFRLSCKPPGTMGVCSPVYILGFQYSHRRSCNGYYRMASADDWQLCGWHYGASGFWGWSGANGIWLVGDGLCGVCTFSLVFYGELPIHELTDTTHFPWAWLSP